MAFGGYAKLREDWPTTDLLVLLAAILKATSPLIGSKEGSYISGRFTLGEVMGKQST